MRRNAPTGSRMAFNNSPGRPLLTDHLKNIDLELELLKRKREMLEHQTQIYETPQYSAFNTPRPFESSQYEPKNFSSNRDYSRMYDDKPYHHTRKRPAESPWEHDAPIKMFVGKNEKKNVVAAFGHRLGPKQNARPRTGPTRAYTALPQPSKPSIGQRIASQRQTFKAPQKNFAPNKVTKPQPAKVSTKPAPESAIVATKTPSSAKDDLILREDRIPTQQMTGRLELALGAIMKEIKEVYGSKSPYQSIFHTSTLQRVMKQAIRERIRSVMLGKVVGTGLEIQLLYRDEYPKNTDIDIVNIAMGASSNRREEKNATPFVDSESPVEFYKANMFNLVNNRLKAMFTKIQELYQNGDFPESKISAVGDPGFADETYDTIVSSGGSVEATEDTVQSLSDLKANIAEKLLPGLLKKYTPLILTLLSKDVVYQKIRAAITRRSDAKDKAEKRKLDPEEPIEKSVLPHFVKIIARPTLPKKYVMRNFLEQFNCRSIKKHRTVRNLLFIGFAEKQDYDNILAASGTIVGQATLEILPSERNTQKDNQNSEKDDSAVKGENESEDKEEFTSELEGEINDLLNSIRQSDEEGQNGEVSLENDDNSSNTKTEENNESIAGQEENGGNVTDIEISQENVSKDTSEVVQTAEAPGDAEGGSDSVQTVEDDTAATEDATAVDIDNTNTNDDSEAIHIVDDTTDQKPPEIDDDVQDITEDNEIVEIKDDEDDNVAKKSASDENAGVTDKETTANPADKESEEKLNKIGELKSETKETGRATPTRITRSSTLTPSTIRTRRSSKLGQN